MRRTKKLTIAGVLERWNGTGGGAAQIRTIAGGASRGGVARIAFELPI